MNFVIEKLCLGRADKSLPWSLTPAPSQICREAGSDGASVLDLVVKRDGGVQLGVRASFTNGHTVVLAEKDGSIYALRAIPEESKGE